MDDQDYSSLILYYGREKLFHTMQNLALEAMAQYAGNLSFKFYNGIALVLGNRVQEGIRELNPMQNDRDFNLGVVLALISAHKKCAVVDKEAIIALDTKMKEERKRVTSQSIYYAAVFLYLTGKFDKSKEYCEKALKMTANLPEAMILKGWCDLHLGHRIDKNCLDLFEKALQLGKSIDGNLGQVRYYQMNNDFENAIAVLNKLSIRYPDLNIPLVEKMRSQLSDWRWDYALETSGRILSLEPNNIEALKIKCLILICQNGDFKSAILELQRLFSALNKLEPSNSELFAQISQLISRICGKNQATLELSLKFIEKANQLSPSNAQYLTELGYHLVYLDKFKDAVKYFKQATKVDDGSINALCGLTLCQLTESGPSEQVSQQIEFLTELQGSVKIPLLILMTAKICNNADQAISHLIEASEIQFKNLRTVSFGSEYLRVFNPRLLIEIAEQLLQYSPIQSNVQIGSTTTKSALHITLKHSLNILEAVVKACPGSIYSVYLLAKVQFLCGEITIAASTLQHILQEIDPTYTEAHLLISQIQIQQGQYQKAMQSLEVCLSHNFRVRENPVYHLLNGIVQKNFQQYEEANKSFLSAMNLMTDSSTVDKISLSDKVTLYLEMANTLVLMNQNMEANKVMQEAMDRFTATAEEGRLILANADLALKQGKVAQVLTLLGNIQPGQPYYMQAKTKMAHIYIHNKKDRMAFAHCFQELVTNCPGPESYIMLGDAYMSIQEPDQAIEAYKQALRLTPTDSGIASKLGRAYVRTHQYAKAINYYKEATINPDNSVLKLDFAELYLKLKQFQNAEKTLIDEIEAKKLETEDVDVLQLRTKQLLLLARVREKSGYLNASLSTLKEARDNQYRVQKKISLEQTVGMQEQYRILSKICVLMAEQSISLRDNEQAVHHYKEALKYTPQDAVILASLARLYMQINNMDLCQQTCAHILQVDQQNEAASVMMADISFRKMDFESAAYHFSQLLLTQPTYWTALARLIEVMRRSGNLTNATEFLQRGEQNCLQPSFEAGLNYCKGLFEWYSGNPNTALRLFNNARRDTEWGKQAIFNMIEICINPDGDLPNESAVADSMTEEQRESQQMAIKTAERLLKELQPKPGSMDNESLNYSLLENFILLSSKQRQSIEQALQAFTNIVSQEEYRDHVGPILGTATAYVLLKQSQRAKNQLKRIAKNVWTFEDAEYLERCWLLLADLYIQSNKLEIASELLTKVLEHNRTCVKAHELCGTISEKEQVYRAAAIHYDSAWRCSGKSKPAIGYKLAYNHMKAKRYPDAIDVCQQVLKLHPDFINIKKDILDKCRNNLKL